MNDFKNGDRVVVVNRDFGSYRTGDKGTINDDGYCGRIIMVNFDNDNANYFQPDETCSTHHSVVYAREIKLDE